MARRRKASAHGEERMNFFIPMSDLLLGILFIFIIIIIALSMRIAQDAKRHAIATELLVGANILTPSAIMNRSALKQLNEDAPSKILENRGIAIDIDEENQVFRVQIENPDN